MGPYCWKTAATSLKEVLSPQGYLTDCPLISHIYFVLLYQGLYSQTVFVLKKHTESDLRGDGPSIVPLHSHPGPFIWRHRTSWQHPGS